MIVSGFVHLGFIPPAKLRGNIIDRPGDIPMNAFRTTLAAASLGLASIATSAAADDKATVQAFYDLLSNPGSEAQVAAFFSATSEN